MKASLFIVGAPKCGTTALCHYLSSHPKIYLPDRSNRSDGKFEPHYFAPVGKITAISEYNALYAPMRKDQVGIDASVYYLYFSKYSAKRIQCYNPDAKFIIMIRNPWEVLVSHYRETVYQGSERSKTLEQALNCPNREWSTVDHLGVIKFSNEIMNYFQIFGKEAVKVINFDNFKKDTKIVYKEVLDFIQIEENQFHDFNKVNERKNIKWRSVHRLLTTPPEWAWCFKSMLPIAFRRSVIANLRKINTTSKSTDNRDLILKPETESKVQSIISEELEALENLLDWDLSSWKP